MFYYVLLDVSTDCSSYFLGHQSIISFSFKVINDIFGFEIGFALTNFSKDLVQINHIIS